MKLASKACQIFGAAYRRGGVGWKEDAISIATEPKALSEATHLEAATCAFG